MLTCKEVVKRLSSEEELGIVKRIKLKAHLFICKQCSQYAKHLRIMGSNFKGLFAAKTEQNKDRIAKLETEVIETLRKKNND